MIIAEYTFNSDTDTLPRFNDGYTYSYTDVDNGDGTITRTITSDSSPTSITFGGRSGLISVSYLDTSQVTLMSYMFYNCTNLTSLDVSNWNTSKVTQMDGMFENCTNLTSLDLSNWDTSNVAFIYDMFYNCSSLTSIDLSNFNTSKVTTTSYMFYNCSNLTSLDLSSFDTSKVNNTRYTFQGCTNLTSLDLSNWDTSKVLYMENTFSGCNNLKYLDISNFKINSNRNTAGMFESYGIENIGMLHCDNYTVNTIANNIGADSTIWVQDTKAYEYEDTNNNGVITFRDYKEQEIEINLPQPLRSIGNYKDRLYWDEEKGKYCIEQRIGKGNLNDAYSVAHIGGRWSNDEYYAFNVFFPYNVVSETGQYEVTMISEDFITSTEINAYQNLEYEEFLICRPGSTIIKLSVSRGNITTNNDYMLNYIKSLNTTFYWVMNEPIVIETDITEKINFDTYNDSMYIAVNDSEVSPSNISTVIAMKEKPLILSDWSNVGVFEMYGNISDYINYINIDKSNKKIIFLNNRSWWGDSFIEIDTSHLSSVDGKTIKFVFNKPVIYHCGLFKAGTWADEKKNEIGPATTELIYTFSDAYRISHNSNIFRLQINDPYDEEIICTIQY